MEIMPYERRGPLPLIPADLLKAKKVQEPSDTRFRACCRFLQALWREGNGLGIGWHSTVAGGRRRLGSRLTPADAEQGRNFLTPAIAALARRETIYRESGAFIEQERLFGNLLSSTTLTFNLFGPLRLDLSLAQRVLSICFPELEIHKVTAVLFEHSPGRRTGDLTRDRTAFDVAFVYQRPDGRRGFICCEVKYAESMSTTGHQVHPCFDELSVSSMLYRDPLSALLRVSPLQQLFREHLLAQSALNRGDWVEAAFVLITPRANDHAQRAGQLYAAHLNEPADTHVKFAMVDVEGWIGALGAAGEDDYALALFRRYCDWQAIDRVIDETLGDPPGGSPHWQPCPNMLPLKPKITPVMLAA